MTTTVGYAVKASLVATIEGENFSLLDAMLEAQNNVGATITWHDVKSTVARGTYQVIASGIEHRVIAVDLDNADVADAVTATIWVNGE